MRTIDMQTWSRREHFRFFSTFDHPHFGMCANVDLTAFYPVVKQRGYSLTVAIVYVIARASNAIPEFRYRIRAGKVVEHEIVNPGFTILVDEDLFSFCTVDYVEDFLEFAASAAERIAFVKEHHDELFYEWYSAHYLRGVDRDTGAPTDRYRMVFEYNHREGFLEYKERRKDYRGPYEAYLKVDPFIYFDMDTKTQVFWEPHELDLWLDFA